MHKIFRKITITKMFIYKILKIVPVIKIDRKIMITKSFLCLINVRSFEINRFFFYVY